MNVNNRPILMTNRV